MKELAQYKYPSIQKNSDGGILRVFDVNNIPFRVKRIFSVSAGKGDVRGRHAHKQCNQLISCVSGEIELICKDGNRTTSYILNEKSDGIWVINGVWAEQRYLTDTAVILVFCDQSYDEDDYIRDYDEFLEWRKRIR